MERQGKGRGCRVVLVPLPLPGHLYPMLQMGLALYNCGFSVTVIHSTLFSPSPSQYPNFDLKPISNGSSELQASIANLIDFIQILNKISEAPFRKHMLELVEETGKVEKIVCIISDIFAHFTESTALELGVPRFIFYTVNLNSFVALIMAVHRIRDVPLRDLYSEDLFEELPPLRKKDLISLELNVKQESQDAWYKLLDVLLKSAKQSSGLIFYSFEYLEQSDWISKFKQQFGSPYFFPIAPHNINDSPPSFHSMLKPNEDCIQWLDQQEHNNSVIYVSFGSLVCITKCQLLEMAYGLSRSKLPFLWVLRPGMVIGEEHIKLPDEIKDIVELKKGFIVDWAPQRKVLAHRAVGGFWTHCGWNSVMESICEGVPMICTPWAGDQNINSRFVTHVWKMGIEMEKEFQSEVIKKTVRRLMVEEERDEMKQNAEAMKEKATLYHSSGGASFNDFIQSIVNTI